MVLHEPDVGSELICPASQDDCCCLAERDLERGVLPLQRALALAEADVPVRDVVLQPRIWDWRPLMARVTVPSRESLSCLARASRLSAKPAVGVVPSVPAILAVVPAASAS